jgi:hypothetical protein
MNEDEIIELNFRKPSKLLRAVKSAHGDYNLIMDLAAGLNVEASFICNAWEIRCPISGVLLYEPMSTEETIKKLRRVSIYP